MRPPGLEPGTPRSEESSVESVENRVLEVSSDFSEEYREYEKNIFKDIKKLYESNKEDFELWARDKHSGDYSRLVRNVLERINKMNITNSNHFQ
jgi:hypothetical protein